MKRLFILTISLLLQIYVFAQRGRVRPEDLGYSNDDYGTSSSDGSPTFYLILLILMIIGILWFNIALKASNKKDIKEKRTYVARWHIKAYAKVFPRSGGCKPQGPVDIPKYTKCYIMEYLEENYCKVKFENYPEPLYIKRHEITKPDMV